MKKHPAIASLALFITSAFAIQAHAGLEEAIKISLTCYEQGESVETTKGNITTSKAKAILSKITNRTIIDQVANDQNLSFSSKATLIGIVDETTSQINLVVRDNGVDYPIDNSSATESEGSYNYTVKIDSGKETFAATASGWFHVRYMLGDVTVSGLLTEKSSVSGTYASGTYELGINKISATITGPVTGTDGASRDYSGTVKITGKYAP